MVNLLGIIEDIGTVIQKILISLCSAIFSIVGYTYEVFIYISELNILNPASYEDLMNKVYGVLGVFVLFIIAYNILLIIVDPDKNKGGKYFQEIFKKTVWTIILIVACPWIFNFAYQVQNSVLTSHILFNFFSGQTTGVEQDGKTEIRDAGARMGVSVFKSFFRPASGDADICTLKNAEDGPKIDKLVSPSNKEVKYHTTCPGLEEGSSIDCSDDGKCVLAQAYGGAEATGNYSFFKAFSRNIVRDEVDFDWFLALIAGGYLAYCIVSFCFDVAIRACKLGLYQIIAPLCLACRIFPKWEGITKTWYQKTLNTFFALFNRMLILSLGTFLVTQFLNMDFFNRPDVDAHGGVKLFGTAFVILGIITFIKQAPKLVDEIFGIGKDVKFGIREKFKEGITPPQGIMRGAAAIGAGATAGVRNAIAAKKGGKGFLKGAASTVGGFGSGMARGFSKSKDVKDWRGLGNALKSGADGAVSAREDRHKYLSVHGGVGGAIKSMASDFGTNIKNWATGQTPEALRREKAKYDNLQSSNKAMESAFDSLIESESRKGNHLNFKDKNNQVIGSGLDFTRYNDLKNKVADARTKGDNALADRYESLLNVEKNALRAKVCEYAGKGDFINSFDDSAKKKLDSAHQAIEKYKASLLAAADTQGVEDAIPEAERTTFFADLLDEKADFQYRKTNPELDNAVNDAIADMALAKVTADTKKGEVDRINSIINSSNNKIKGARDVIASKQTELQKNREHTESLQNELIEMSVDNSLYSSPSVNFDVSSYIDNAGVLDSAGLISEITNIINDNSRFSQLDAKTKTIFGQIISNTNAQSSLTSEINSQTQIINNEQQVINSENSNLSTAQVAYENAQAAYDKQEQIYNDAYRSANELKGTFDTLEKKVVVANGIVSDELNKISKEDTAKGDKK